MNIIKKEDVDKYRYAIGKIAFLRTYTNFSLIKNYPDSNVMCVKSKLEGLIYVSLFRKPPLTSENQESMLVFYEKKSKNKQNTRLLNKKFNDEYKENLEKAFKYPGEFENSLTATERDILSSLFIDPLNFETKLFKYRSQSSVQENKYGVCEGYLSFSAPSTFNDPFDCNVVFSKNEDMSGLFRVLCMTKTERNILMWSYYGDSHKGYCIEFKFEDIINTIKNSKINGLCIMGEVEYKSDRPKVRNPVKNFSYTDITFYIDASFTKFKEWEHEVEYRFVIISDKLSGFEYPHSDESHLSFEFPLCQIIKGIYCSNKKIKNAKCNSNIRQLSKHSTLYELE